MSIAKENYQLPLECQLHSGDHLSQTEFHSLYVQMPEKFKAELVGGVVFVATPLGNLHGEYHAQAILLFGLYTARTPGVKITDNATLILGEEDEVQPDISMRMVPECGGKASLTKDGYLQGAPELVVEIAHSSRAIDLFNKKERYTKRGVKEYVVVSLQPMEIFWFDLPGSKRYTANNDGVYQSVIFPGLWIHGEALLQLQSERSLEIINAGLASPEHAAFVQQLDGKR